MRLIWPFTLAWQNRDISVQVAKQPRQNSLETSPEKFQAGVRFF